MKNRCISLLFVILLFSQCKTTGLAKFENAVRKSTSINFLNSQEFDKCRDLMLNTFSPDVLKNDSVIILEYFADGTNGYYCTIHESKNKFPQSYMAVRSIKNERIHVDSLEHSNMNDKIMPMVINGQLDEVRKRGDNTTITPASILIINILTRNSDNGTFNVKTVITQNFSPQLD